MNALRRPTGGLPWLAALLAVIVLVPAPGTVHAQAGARAASVQVDRVRQEPLRQTVPILGRMVAREQGAVAARIAGPVQAVHVQVGDRVSAGQLLAELEPDMREAMLARSESDIGMHQARLRAASAQLQISRDELQRLEKLKGSSAFPRARYEEQQLEVVRFTSAKAEAESALARTQAELRAATIELQRSRIVAPYDGVVTRRHVSPGAYLAVGAPVVTLVNDTALEVEADVPADRIAGLQPGTPVRASLTDGEVIDIVVRAVIPDENPSTRTRQVRFSTDIGASRATAVNETVAVRVPVGAERTVLSVHKDAVISRGGQQLVYVVRDGKAAIQPVRLGEALGTRLEVIDGLGAGDPVVVRGNERLQPGQPVQATEG